jgi:glutamate/tyrosine decarboxylase-like PLP-dependent enzyme
MTLPHKGLDPAQIEQALSSFKKHDIDWRDGRVLAYVYDAGQGAEQIVKDAFVQFMSENALDPTTFPSTMQMEREVVRITAELLQGDQDVVGHITTGGTESIMLAVKTARDWARANRPTIKQPEMILSRVDHAAFHKAAHYLGVKLVIVPFDEKSYQTNVGAMRDAINENTILLVASAPNYSHGVIGPVAEIAALADENNILCHVDACIGGYHLAFMRQLGYRLPPFDFAVPGVTSLSVDLHKYGYAAKGASVILYRNKELRRFQIYANLSTTAYTIVNPTVLSTKSGGPIAASWAILHYLGQDGYREIVRQTMAATEKLIAGIQSLGDLQILGKPDMCIFALESATLNVFQLADLMKKKGWYLQPQFSKTADRRPNIHITVTRATVPHVDDLLRDLKEAIAEAKAMPPLDAGVAGKQIAALLQTMPEDELVAALYQLAGIEGSDLPSEMALINTVLSVLPPTVAEELLITYFNELYV